MADYELTLYRTATEPTRILRGFEGLAEAISVGQTHLDREWEVTDRDNGDRLVWRHRRYEAEV